MLRLIISKVEHIIVLLEHERDEKPEDRPILEINSRNRRIAIGITEAEKLLAWLEYCDLYDKGKAKD